jgi:hypothetical protein
VVVCCREQQCLWRKEDIEQRHLENARVLWARILERNRRDVEEKSEQLKAISTLAALISGFALTAFLQFDFCDYHDTTGAALPVFGTSLALTVSSSADSCAGPTQGTSGSTAATAPQLHAGIYAVRTAAGHTWEL